MAELTVLGFVGGKVWTGKEYEDATAENVQNPLAELTAFDLNGSLKKNGGWIDDTYSAEANEAMLVLDWSDKESGNEFQHLACSLENPLGEDTHDAGSAGGGGGAAAGAGAGSGAGGSVEPREANVTTVEIMVNGFPRIVVVTIRSVSVNDELILDYGQAQADIARRVYKRAHHQAYLNKMINESQNRIDDLEHDVNSYIPRQRKDQEQLQDARTAAVILQEVGDVSVHAHARVRVAGMGTAHWAQRSPNRSSRPAHNTATSLCTGLCTVGKH